MKTAHKIAAAKLIYRSLHLMRRIGGAANDEVVVSRREIRYALDLAQGIDLAIYLQGQFEPSTSRAYATLVKGGDLVLDIGANIGAHTLNLARLVGPSGRVIAVEPTSFAFRKLERNLALNADLAKRVTAVHCFLAENDGGLAPNFVYSSWPLVAKAGLHPTHLGEPAEIASAAIRSLDSLLAETAVGRQVSFVKMDVDGHEGEVLAGARQMMERDRPAFVLELAPYALEECGGSLGALLGYFIPLSYEFYHEKTKRRLPADADKLAEMIGEGSGINVIAIARSRTKPGQP